MTAKRKPGRPRLGKPATTTVAFRAPVADKVAWDRAAAALGAELGRPVTLGEWVRMQCERALATV